MLSKGLAANERLFTICIFFCKLFLQTAVIEFVTTWHSMITLYSVSQHSNKEKLGKIEITETSNPAFLLQLLIARIQLTLQDLPYFGGIWGIFGFPSKVLMVPTCLLDSKIL